MADDDRIDPGDQIPEADLLEQRTALDPRQLTDPGPVPGILDGLAGPVEEADRLEQQASVPGDDEEDYPREP